MAELIIQSNGGPGWRRPTDGPGSDAPAIFLLHGLGANHEVWSPLTDVIGEAPGLWVAPDLAGHGQSPWTGAYSLDDHAADVAELIAAYDCADDVVIVGHSMGGAVALALASGRFGLTPRRVLAFGVKIAWTPEELAWLDGLATAPVRYMPTMDEAMVRYLKVSGLTRFTEPWSYMAKRGVAQDRGRSDWRLAADPATASVGAPDMDKLVAAAGCPISLAAGEHDPMSSVDGLRRWDPRAQAFAGLGHNAMVEEPATVWAWVRTMIAQT